MRAIFVIAVWVLGPVLFAQPLAIRNHRSVSLPFLRIRPVTHPIREFQFTERWNAELSLSNEASLQVNESQFIEEDGEFARLNIVWETVKVGHYSWIEVPVSSFSGGVLDPIIDGLHGIFLGLADPVRDRQPQGRAIIRTQDKTFGSGVGLGGVTFGHARSIGSGLVLSGAVKIPTSSGNGMFDTGSIDAGVGLGGRFSIAKNIDADIHFGIVRQGNWKAFDGVRPWVDHETVAVSYRPNSKDTWILQFQSERSALRQFIPSSDAVHRKGTLAYRYQGSNGRQWTVFISEDYDPINNINPVQKNIGPDVVLGWYVTLSSQLRKR